MTHPQHELIDTESYLQSEGDPSSPSSVFCGALPSSIGGSNIPSDRSNAKEGEYIDDEQVQP